MRTWTLPNNLNAGYSLATQSSATQEKLFQNTATKTKFIHIPFLSGWIHANYYRHSFFSFSFFSGMNDLTADYNSKYNIEEEITQGRRGEEQKGIYQFK